MRGNDLAVGDDDNGVGREPLQQLLRFGGADLFGLVYEDACCQGGFLDRRWRDMPAAAARAVGLRDYGGDFYVGLREEGGGGGGGGVGGGAEGDAHEVRPNGR